MLAVRLIQLTRDGGHKDPKYDLHAVSHIIALNYVGESLTEKDPQQGLWTAGVVPEIRHDIPKMLDRTRTLAIRSGLTPITKRHRVAMPLVVQHQIQNSPR